MSPKNIDNEAPRGKAARYLRNSPKPSTLLRPAYAKASAGKQGFAGFSSPSSPASPATGYSAKENKEGVLHISASLGLPAQAGEGQRYEIVIGPGLAPELLSAISKEGASRRVAIITDSNLSAGFGRELQEKIAEMGLSAEIFEFPAGEVHKNQGTVTKLQNELLAKRYGRDSLIAALGGGIVGDVAGFVAATYLRGVPYINIPTTLLGMVDSSIGGKVGIDTPYGKNTVGAFWAPRAVIINLSYLSGLPRKEIVNGALEAVKTFFTSDAGAVALISRLDAESPARDMGLLGEIVKTSVRIKADLTTRDPREENERKVVNFGHTIGHALELLSGYKLAHGYAVGYGMLVESRISELLGILPPQDRAEIVRVLAHLGVEPDDLPKFPAEKIIEATKGDKKARGGASHYVLLESIGLVWKKGGQFAHPVDNEIVRKALESV